MAAVNVEGEGVVVLKEKVGEGMSTHAVLVKGWGWSGWGGGGIRDSNAAMQ